MGASVLGDCSRGSYQRLTDDLPTVDALPALVGAGGQVVIQFDFFEIEGLDDLTDRLHRQSQILIGPSQDH